MSNRRSTPEATDTAAPRLRAAEVALVLGAGGPSGYAFTTGALAALADHGRWDARDAALAVGTSAGAAACSLLRAGLSPADHYAHTLGRPLSSEGEHLVRRLPAAAWNSGADGPARRLPASARLAGRTVLKWPPRPGLALAGGLPPGRRSPSPMGDRHRALHPAWPERPLWLCSVAMGRGNRVVFGRDDHPPLDVGAAVEASSAVPGFFTPVAQHGDRYVDGGVWSSTNADLVAGLGFDAVLVVAPLSSPIPARALPGWLRARRGSAPDPWRMTMRAYHRSVLAAELRQIRRHGTPVIAIEPTVDDLRLLEADLPGDRGDVAEAAYASVTELLHARPEFGATLRGPVVA